MLWPDQNQGKIFGERVPGNELYTCQNCTEWVPVLSCNQKCWEEEGYQVWFCKKIPNIQLYSNHLRIKTWNGPRNRHTAKKVTLKWVCCWWNCQVGHQWLVIKSLKWRTETPGILDVWHGTLDDSISRMMMMMYWTSWADNEEVEKRRDFIF